MKSMDVSVTDALWIRENAHLVEAKELFTVNNWVYENRLE